MNIINIMEVYNGKKNESFEIMIKKLEDIVEVMNKGQLNLEDSIKNYEEGIKLCNKLLKH